MNEKIQNLKSVISKIKQRDASVATEVLKHINAFENKSNESYEYVESGMIKYQRNDLVGASQDFDNAIKLYPNADAYYNRGVIQMDRENLINGITDFTAAILLYPEHGNAYHNRGHCVLAILSFEGAMKSSECSDILEFARNDLKKSISLGNNNSAEYLRASY